MPYVTLSPQDIQHIRWQRVNALEIELESLNLLLEETPDNTELLQRVTRVSEYLSLHIKKLPQPGQTPADD